MPCHSQLATFLHDSQLHSASAREGLYASVMSEHQHLVSLISFKTVWQHAATVKKYWPDLESMAYGSH